MDDFANEFALRDGNTGGRGTDEIRSHVYSLLSRYRTRMGSFKAPIEVSMLAELQNARIICRHGSKNWVASLMPIGSGFVISVNEYFPENRRRNAICHEIAHTFFFDTSGKSPTRVKNTRTDFNEERVCFWAAREMLVPFPLLKSELDHLGLEAVYTFRGILTLCGIFVVSPDIIAHRLTHDLGLLGDDWIILWYSNGSSVGKLKPRSLYPKHISTYTSDFFKKKINEAVRGMVQECLGAGKTAEMEYKIGERKALRVKVRTEQVDREKLCAISWVSPLQHG